MNSYDTNLRPPKGGGLNHTSKLGAAFAALLVAGFAAGGVMAKGGTAKPPVGGGGGFGRCWGACVCWRVRGCHMCDWLLLWRPR